MPTVVFVSPKGGVGKTTAATILATQLARQSSVVVLDADPNRPITAWARLGGTPSNVTVYNDVNQENLIERADEAARQAPFVIIDCEGTASLTVAYAIGAADLVIVPAQGSQLDAKEAARALSLVKNQERQARRRIPHAVLLTRTNPIIRPRTLAHVQTEFARHGVLLLETQLNEREAFKALFSYGGTLEGLSPAHVPNLEKAVANARALAAEVVGVLRAGLDQTYPEKVA